MLTKSVSVVLPAYDEKDNIRNVVETSAHLLSSITEDFEIIAVDDGSVDGTAKALEDLQSCDNHLKVIRHEKNKGYGAALVSGFQKAEKELILMMDADRQFDITEVTKFFPYIEDYDIVAGFRIKRKDPLYRCILGYAANFCIRFLFGIKMKDIKCGFKLFKTGIIKKMNLAATGGVVNIEILAFAKKHNLAIKEIGINHYPRIHGKPKGVNPKVILRAFLEMLSLKWELLRDER